MPVKCTFDSCAGNCWLLVWQFYSQSWKFVKNRKKLREKIIKFVLWRRKTQFCKKCRKKNVRSHFCALTPKLIEKIMFLRESCFVSKMILCTIRMQIWRPCRTAPTIVRYKFQHKYQKICTNCLFIFQRWIKFSLNDRLYT